MVVQFTSEKYVMYQLSQEAEINNYIVLYMFRRVYGTMLLLYNKGVLLGEVVNECALYIESYLPVTLLMRRERKGKVYGK